MKWLKDDQRARALLAAALTSGLAALSSCSDDEAPTRTTSSSSGAGAGAAGAGAAGGGGSDVGGGEPGELVTEQWGARTWGPILAISRTDRTLWLGTSGISDPDSKGGEIRGGLTRLDIDTGEVRRFESELPTETYENGQLGPTPTATVVSDGDVHLAAAPFGIVVQEGESFTLQEIEVEPGVLASPGTLVVDRNGDRHRIWASTNRGLLRLDADTFEIEAAWGAAELGSDQIGHVALDPATGAVYAVVFAQPEMRVVRIEETDVSIVSSSELGNPGAYLGQVVWSTFADAALVAVASWDGSSGGVVSWNGGMPATIATEASLSTAAFGMTRPFGALTLAVDDDHGILVVGGAIRVVPPINILEGGGIAWVDLATSAMTGLSMSTSLFPGDDIASIAIDPVTLRTFVVARRPCNEGLRAELGLLAVSFRADGSPRFERPILSGVRSAAVVGGELLVGLNDEARLGCFGYTSQAGLVEVKSNRGGELVPLDKGFWADIPPFPVTTSLQALDAEHVAYTSTGHGAYWGPVPGGSFAYPTDFMTSHFQHDVAWAGPTELWMGGRAEHSPGDDAYLADRGPRGAVRLKLDDEGKVVNPDHFVRASEDGSALAGLPTSEITAIAIAPDGTAYLACGTERVGGDTDRAIRDVFLLDGQPRLGGVASIAPDSTITVLSAPGEIPDPQGIGFDAAGDLVVLDVERGALRLQDGQWDTIPMSGVPDGARPKRLRFFPGPSRAAMYDAGALVSIGAATTMVEDVGHAWDATERATSVLVVGTDEGLVRVRRSDVADVAEPDPEPGSLPPFSSMGIH